MSSAFPKIHTPAVRPPSFALTHISDIEPSLDARDFVEGLLIEGGASVIYAPSNVGKTFWIMDVAAHVATGKAWRFGEHEVDQGAVVFVALEGEGGAKNRIEGMRREGILTDEDPFYLITVPVNLLEPVDAEMLAESVSQAASKSGMPVKLVVIDTLSRAMAGGNENAPQDMTSFVAAIDAIRAKTGAHVAIVHHCGKDEARGARGHSSLRAAVDTEIELHRPEAENIITVRVTKQRDLPTGEPMPFSLKLVTLGLNPSGKPVTTCVVMQQNSVMAAEKSKGGRKATSKPEDLLELLPMDSVNSWKTAADEEQGVKPTKFYEHKKFLESQGLIKRENNRLLRA
jgi:hypothetical protein